MTSQMRRCGVSIPANIAEGLWTCSDGAFVQFLRIAQGSLKELETHAAACASGWAADDADGSRSWPALTTTREDAAFV